MRIVTYPLTEYEKKHHRTYYAPYGGVQEFGRTVVVDGNLIGEYKGDATEEQLATYQGVWPIPPEPGPPPSTKQALLDQLAVVAMELEELETMLELQ